MKKITKLAIAFLLGAIVFTATTAFILIHPEPDFSEKNVFLNKPISIFELPTENQAIGFFKTFLKFKQDNFNSLSKEFYGQEIYIAENPKVDRILIGVTNNLISRVEIWNKGKLMETRELGFVGKMTWGEMQTMTVEFYDQSNRRYKAESKISMRFYSGTGFLGDIGTMHMDLTEYGNFSGPKSVGVFAKPIDSNNVNQPEFSEFKIWKNFKSVD